MVFNFESITPFVLFLNCFDWLIEGDFSFPLQESRCLWLNAVPLSLWGLLKKRPSSETNFSMTQCLSTWNIWNSVTLLFRWTGAFYVSDYFQFAFFLFLYGSFPVQNKAKHAWEAGKITSSLNMLYDGNFTTHSSHAFRQVITARAR